MRQAMSEVSNLVIGPAPLLPSVRRFQVSSTPVAIGEPTPTPVTPPLRIKSCSPIRQRGGKTSGLLPPRCNQWPSPRGGNPYPSSGTLFNELDSIADGLDRFGRVIGDLDAELLFERHDEFNRIEAVGAEIVDKAGFRIHLLVTHAPGLDH